MTAYPSTFYCSNQLGHILLEGLMDVMGEMGVGELLNQVGMTGTQIEEHAPVSFVVFSGIQSSLENIYGEMGGRGLALRAGRASFHYGLRMFGERFGMTTPDFRLMPTRTKVQVGAQLLAKALNQISDQHVCIKENKTEFQWIVERCPVCWERHSDEPVCHYNLGFLQEFLSWAGGGKYYPVTETECVAVGAPACVFSISKQALE